MCMLWRLLRAWWTARWRRHTAPPRKVRVLQSRPHLLVVAVEDAGIALLPATAPQGRRWQAGPGTQVLARPGRVGQSARPHGLVRTGGCPGSLSGESHAGRPGRGCGGRPQPRGPGQSHLVLQPQGVRNRAPPAPRPLAVPWDRGHGSCCVPRTACFPVRASGSQRRWARGHLSSG